MGSVAWRSLSNSQIFSAAPQIQELLTSTDGADCQLRRRWVQTVNFLGAPDQTLVNDYDDDNEEEESKNDEKKEMESSKKRKRSEKSETKKEERTTLEDKDKIIQDWVEYERKEGHFALLKDHIKGDEPSDVALKQWVLAYCVCHDMGSVTLRDVLDTASDKFGVDMRNRKDRIKWFLAGEM